MINTVTKDYDENNNFIGYQVVYANDEKWFVPHNEANRHYQEILEWVENGGVIVDNGA